MKNFLNVLVDMLTLAALCVAAVGHLFPWFDADRIPSFAMGAFTEFQQWHADRSGGSLAILGALVGLSLLVNWSPQMRRVLTMLMFGSAFAALLFQLMVFTDFHAAYLETHRLGRKDISAGFMLSLIPTCIALGFSLLRMLWTMPPTRMPKTIPVALPPLVSPADKKIHPF